MIQTFTDYDCYLFKEGTHCRLYEKLGAHPVQWEDSIGTHFAVYAPNADEVSVIGSFNNWNPHSNRMVPCLCASDIWETIIPEVGQDVLYKYRIVNKSYKVEKGDPFAFRWEEPPATASIIWDMRYEWKDVNWMQNRKRANALDAPISIYELHLGAWQRQAEEKRGFLCYRELAVLVADYVRNMGFSHIEILPITEHPFYRSWGYQSIGYFSPTSRYGTPQDLMYFVDSLHQQGIGVILDWVPSHFPSDEHGLAYFDGTFLFEYSDPRRRVHPEWTSLIFDFSRNEVRSFLLSSALFWLDKYHIDGLRIDGVSSMLYLNYGRRQGDWTPNCFGTYENLEAMSFLRELNETIYKYYPDVQTFAEEATDWPMVSHPTYSGGLGFGFKWNMGWMHDTLEYFKNHPSKRRQHHQQITFSLCYAFSENFVLTLSHDEVYYGKGSLLSRMPGNEWEKFANLRLLFGYMWAHPGKKLLFMGGEIAQTEEWDHDRPLQWELLQHKEHKTIQTWIRDLNSLLGKEASLFKHDFSHKGFEWIDCDNHERCVLSFLRKGEDAGDAVLVVCNFSETTWEGFRVGVVQKGIWRMLLNSDSRKYGGKGNANEINMQATPFPANGRDYSLELVVPALSIMFLKPLT